jgi:hypothetical protein
MGDQNMSENPEPERDNPDPVWPEPRDDPDEEPAEPWARPGDGDSDTEP